jgi:hypothetical protein
MEVEFLSNMRYSLYIGDQEWKDWRIKLGRFWAYWDKASKLPLAPPPPTPEATAALRPMPPPLPSPPCTSPPYTPSHSAPPASGNSFQLPTPAVSLDPPYFPTMPMPQADFGSFSRKRSLDYSSAMQPPNKRVAGSQVPKLSVNVPPFPTTLPPALPQPSASARLQPLDYPLQPTNPPRSVDTLLALHPPQPQHPQLPPPCTRSMSMVYPQPSSASPATSGPPHFSFSPYSTRQASPYSAHHSGASSPITPSFGSHGSPTWGVLGNRESPYRPVRTVNTLLVPPQHMEAPQQVPYDTMHYHPLAKSKFEYKTGPVPYLPEVSWWSDNNNYYA